ncbi:MAG: SpoIIIAC/SpoIIIAD family protein [Anaerovoracaceae bacterium]
MEIIKIALIALIGVILSQTIKNIKPDFVIYIVLATVIIIFTLSIEKLTAVFAFLESVYGSITYGKTFFPIIIKVLIVAYIADFTSQLCRDSGEGAIAGKVELAGKIIIFYMAVPILAAILELINSVLI